MQAVKMVMSVNHARVIIGRGGRNEARLFFILKVHLSCSILRYDVGPDPFSRINAERVFVETDSYVLRCSQSTRRGDLVQMVLMLQT